MVPKCFLSNCYGTSRRRLERTNPNGLAQNRHTFHAGEQVPIKDHGPADAAPDIQEEVLLGRDARGLRELMAVVKELEWENQRLCRRLSRKAS